jgi:hypothetical protein
MDLLRRSVMAGIGPAPKPASKRRRRTPPRTYGAATPVTAPAAPVGDRELEIEDPHPLVIGMWEALGRSVESKFFSHADWQRVRWELWHANETMRKPTAAAWDTVQHGLNELLVSPAAKRRAAIELKAAGPDSDEIAAVSMMSQYKSKLKPV